MPTLIPNPRWIAAALCLALILPPSPAHALRPELDHAGVEQALNAAAGAEAKPFPEPMYLGENPLYPFDKYATFLNRDLFQEQLLREQILPDLVRRNAATRALTFAFLGISTGEEPARFWHWVREWFREKDLPVGGEAGWEIRFLLVDKNPVLMKVAQDRFRGAGPDSRFGYRVDSDAQRKEPDIRRKILEFSREIVRTVESDRALIEQSFEWIRKDMTDPEVLEKVVREADLVVSNQGSSYIEVPHDLPATDKLSRAFWKTLTASEKAWILTTDIIVTFFKDPRRRVLAFDVRASPMDGSSIRHLQYRLLPPLTAPAAGAEDRDPLNRVRPAQTMGELNLQARGKLYEMRSKPALGEVEDLLRSRAREYGVYGVSYRSQQRLWIGIGDGEEVVSDGLVWNVMDRHPEIRRRLEIHNHPSGPNFPSGTDFSVLENQISTLSPRRRAARHFVYGPRTGRLIEYGIREPSGRPFPKKIRLRVWGEQGHLIESHLFTGTQNAPVSKNRHAASNSSAWLERFNLWVARAENVGAGEILRVELEDPFGDWVRWRRDVTLASVLKKAGLVRSAAGAEQIGDVFDLVEGEKADGPKVLFLFPPGEKVIAEYRKLAGRLFVLKDEREPSSSLEPAQLRKLVREINPDYLATFVNDRVDAALLSEQVTPNLKGITHMGVGTEKIDLKAAADRDLKVSFVGGGDNPLRKATAEMADALALTAWFDLVRRVEPATTTTAPNRLLGPFLRGVLSERPGEWMQVADLLWAQLLRQARKVDEGRRLALEDRFRGAGNGGFLTVRGHQLSGDFTLGIKTSIGLVGPQPFIERWAKLAKAHEVRQLFYSGERHPDLESWLGSETFTLTHLSSEDEVAESSDYLLRAPDAKGAISMEVRRRMDAQRGYPWLVDADLLALKPELPISEMQGLLSRLLTRQAIGFLGMVGSIGSTALQSLAPLAGRLLAVQHSEKETYQHLQKQYGIGYADLDALLKGSESGMVILSLPGSDEAAEVITPERLERLGIEDLLIVNIGRGKALARSREEENRWAGFLRQHPRIRLATDVLAEENVPASQQPLLAPDLRNQVLVTAHIASNAEQPGGPSVREDGMGMVMVLNFEAMLAGQLLPNPVPLPPAAGAEEGWRVSAKAAFPSGLEPEARAVIDRRIVSVAREQGPEVNLGTEIVPKLRSRLNWIGDSEFSSSSFTLAQLELLEDIENDTETGDPRSPEQQQALLRYVESAGIIRAPAAGAEQEGNLAWRWAAAVGLGIAALPGGQDLSIAGGKTDAAALQAKQSKIAEQRKAYQEAIRTTDYLKKIELLKKLVIPEALESLWRLQEPMDPRAAFKTYEQWRVAAGAIPGYMKEDLYRLSGFLGAEGRYKEAAELLREHLEHNDVLKRDPTQKKAVLKRLSEVHAALGDYGKILEGKEDLWSLPLSVLKEIKVSLDARSLPHPPLRPYLPSADMAHLRLNPKAPVYLHVNPRAAAKKDEKFFREMVEDVSAGLLHVSGGRFGLDLKGVSFEAPETWRGKIEYPVDLVTAPKIQEQAGKAFVVLAGYPVSGGTHYNGRGILFLRDLPKGSAEDKLQLARLILRGFGSEPLPLDLQKKDHLFRNEEAGANLENSMGERLYLGASPALQFRVGWPEVGWIPLKSDQIRDHLPPPVKKSAAGAEELTTEQRLGVLAEAMPGGQGLAVQASVLGGRPDLKEFLFRLPQQAGLETVVLEGDDPADWGVTLAGLEAERVVFLGEQKAGQRLRRILPEIPITVLSPGAGMEQLLLGLGLSADLLIQINAAGMEQQLVSDQSA